MVFNDRNFILTRKYDGRGGAKTYLGRLVRYFVKQLCKEAFVNFKYT